MNQIQEMDWADERWHGHTGMEQQQRLLCCRRG